MDLSQHFMLYDNIPASLQATDENSENEVPSKPSILQISMENQLTSNPPYLSKHLLSPNSKQIAKKQRRSNNQAVFAWLDDNYELKEDECLARSVMYNHYLDYCKRNAIFPVSPASFGKIIKQKFPELKTRRLGTRGQSKYHYYGVSIKSGSLYYRSSEHKNGLSRFSTSIGNGIGTPLTPKSKKDNSSVCFPNVKLRTPLPDFPDTSYLDLSPPSYKTKLETFMIMYRTHCQRIMDSVIRANFEEVNDLMVHFWQGMPPHMLEVLNYSITLHIITICDIMLYRVLGEVLIPASLQALPDSLLSDIKDFALNIKEWLFEALSDLPATLMIRKIELAKSFSKILIRQTTLVMLAQTARGVLRNCESVSIMLEDWRGINFRDIAVRLTFFNQPAQSEENDLVRLICYELESLFVKQAPLDLYLEWIDSMINSQVVLPAASNINSFRAKSRRFLLEWFYIGRIIEEEMTIKSAPSFGCFRLLYLMLSEYVFYIIEHLIYQKIEKGYEDVLREIFIAHNPTQQPLEKIPTRSIEIIVPGGDLSPGLDERILPFSEEYHSSRNYPTGILSYPVFSKIPFTECAAVEKNSEKLPIGFPSGSSKNIVTEPVINSDFPSPIVQSVPIDPTRGVFRFDFPRILPHHERLKIPVLANNPSLHVHQNNDSSDTPSSRRSPTCFRPANSLCINESIDRQGSISNEVFSNDLSYPPGFDYSDDCYSHSDLSDMHDPPTAIPQSLFPQKQFSFHPRSLQEESPFPPPGINKLHPSASHPYVLASEPARDHALQSAVLNSGPMITSARLVYPSGMANPNF